MKVKNVCCKSLPITDEMIERFNNSIYTTVSESDDNDFEIYDSVEFLAKCQIYHTKHIHLIKFDAT